MVAPVQLPLSLRYPDSKRKRHYHKLLQLVASILSLLAVQLHACAVTQVESTGVSAPERQTDSSISWPEQTATTISTISVRDVPLQDIFRGIAQEYELNLIVDPAVEGTASLRFSNIPVSDVLLYLCDTYNLEINVDNSIIHVAPKRPPPLPPYIPQISVSNSLLTANLEDDDLAAVVRTLSDSSSLDIVIQAGVSGFLSGSVSSVPVVHGLRTLLESNNFSLRERDGILVIDRLGLQEGDMPGARRNLWVQASDSLVSLDVVNAPISAVIASLADQTGASIITYTVPDGSISVQAENLTLSEALQLLLRDTEVTFRQQGDLYIIASRSARGIASVKLIRLGHVRADTALELIPDHILQDASIQIVREHNGLLVTGTSEVISETEAIVSQLDYPTPQILIEALVVDFQSTDLFELGITLGRDAEIAGNVANTYLFGGAPGQSGGLEATGNADEANAYLDDLSNIIGIGIGKLPADFYFRLNALSQEGRANIRSRPQVATLNGHSASISIGTKQYFILKTATPYQGTSNVVVQETERFEAIEANVKLDITPWVSSSGEVTAEIRPEFSTPIGDLDPEVPPTINSRVLDSTVRLQDGETIILGGLIQDVETINHNKVPILGSIPVLGRLFRNRSTSTVKSELVIFLTPHVFYGNDRDNEKWNAIRDDLDLTTDKQPGFFEINR